VQENILKFRVEWMGQKNVCFQRKTTHNLETVRDTDKVTINH